MAPQAVLGLTTTYPYTMSPDVARHQCDECGGWERSDKGSIRHSKRCDSKPQAAPVLAKSPAQLDREVYEAIRDQELKAFAKNVRRTGLTKGRDQDTLDAVRKGYLSVDEAMNTDD